MEKSFQSTIWTEVAINLDRFAMRNDFPHFTSISPRDFFARAGTTRDAKRIVENVRSARNARWPMRHDTGM